MSADFTLQLGKVAHVLEMRVETVKKKVAFDLYAQIIQKTPVDTGRARASWNISVNNPDPSVAPEMDKSKNSDGKKLKRGDSLTGIEAGKNISLLESNLEDPIYITNNLDYIEYLEGGSSEQAPAGMVMLSVQAILTELEIITAQAINENPI